MTYNDYLLKALQAAVIAGSCILKVYDSDFAVENKADKSPLTLADKQSHKVIFEILSEYSVPILSEEGDDISFDERKNWKKLWIIDPLDGTKEFISRNGEFTVNIALVIDGKPEIGIIYVPVKNVLYFAKKGTGSFMLDDKALIDILREKKLSGKNDRSLSAFYEKAIRLPASCSSERSFTIVTSRSHPSPRISDFVQHTKSNLGPVQVVFAGSSLKFCSIAKREADLYPRFGPTMEWDTAAGQAIAENAGGVVFDCRTGQSLKYNKKSLFNPWFIAGEKDVLEKISEGWKGDRE